MDYNTLAPTLVFRYDGSLGTLSPSNGATNK